MNHLPGEFSSVSVTVFIPFTAPVVVVLFSLFLFFGLSVSVTVFIPFTAPVVAVLFSLFLFFGLFVVMQES